MVSNDTPVTFAVVDGQVTMTRTLPHSAPGRDQSTVGLMANKDLPLKVEIVGGIVTVTIGVSTLCTAVAAGGTFPPEPRFTDEYAFARAVVAQLAQEDEDGTTRVHRLLELAAVEAIEDGADGVRFPGDA